MCHGGIIPETWGDVSVQVLWEIQTEAVIEIRFGYADVETWKPEVMENLFDRLGKSISTSTRSIFMKNKYFFSTFPLG